MEWVDPLQLLQQNPYGRAWFANPTSHYGLVCVDLMTPGLSIGHSVSCTTILFLNLQITTSDIRPHINWAGQPVDCIWSL